MLTRQVDNSRMLMAPAGTPAPSQSCEAGAQEPAEATPGTAHARHHRRSGRFSARELEAAGMLTALVSAVVGALLSALVAYPVGRYQGRQQTLNQERLRALTEIRSSIIELDADFVMFLNVPEDESYVSTFFTKLMNLRHDFEEKSVWFVQKAVSEIRTMFSSYWEIGTKLQDATRQGADGGKARHEIMEEKMQYLIEQSQLREKFENFSRRLIGTHRPWWHRMFGT